MILVSGGDSKTIWHDLNFVLLVLKKLRCWDLTACYSIPYYYWTLWNWAAHCACMCCVNVLLYLQDAVHISLAEFHPTEPKLLNKGCICILHHASLPIICTRRQNLVDSDPVAMGLLRGCYENDECVTVIAPKYIQYQYVPGRVMFIGSIEVRMRQLQIPMSCHPLDVYVVCI